MRILVNIDVPALDPAIDFYCKALSLHLSRRIDIDVAELTGATATLYLLECKEGSHPTKTGSDTRRYLRHWTPVHIDFVVDDISLASAQVIKAGGVQESACIEWMGSKCISFSDPFGHGFCLIEFADDTYRSSAD